MSEVRLSSSVREPRKIGTYVAAAVSVLSIILFGVAVLSGDGGAKAIQKVFAEDAAGQAVLNQAVQVDTSPTDAIDQYVLHLKEINLDSCPKDFKDAYVKYIAAWERFDAEFHREPQSFGQGLWMGYVNLLRGELDGGYNRMNDAHEAATQQIRSSWFDVMAIAKRCGVKVS